MKMRLPSFLAGMLTMALVASLGVGALAASGAFTITVNPVNIQLNGQTFHPKDANGKDVPVFNYDGTTYAPLRALAEAYGLTVGWDQDAQMATVGETSAPPDADAPLPTDYSDWSEEDEAAYQEFKELWEVSVTGCEIIDLKTKDQILKKTLLEYFNATPEEEVKVYNARLSTELYQLYSVDADGNDITRTGGAFIAYRYLDQMLWQDFCYQYIDQKTFEIRSQSTFKYNKEDVIWKLKSA